MLFIGLNLITAVCFVSTIGILCNYQCWAEESLQVKGSEQNVYEGSLNLQNEKNDCLHIIRKRDTDDKPDIPDLPLDDVPILETKNYPESSNYDMFLDAPHTTPVSRANLYTKSKNSKPSVKSSEKRNNRLSKNSPLKSKSGLDNINGKVLSLDCGCWNLPSVQKSQQKSEETINENLYRPCNVNPADTQGDFKNFKDDVNELGQISKIEKVNDYIDTIPKNGHLTEDINNIESRNLILPERLTEILQEQNIILKEILLKIDHYGNVTGKERPEAKGRRVDPILDVKNTGSRSFNVGLNPIFKFKDEYNLSNLNVDKDWVKTSRDSTSKIDVKMNGGKKVLNSYGHNTYDPFSYSDPVVNMASQIPVLNRYKSSKRQHNDTPHIIDDVYLSKTNKINTISTSLNDIVSGTPQFNYYNGYIKSPNHLPHSKSYFKARYPYYGVEYKYI